nr:OsmC family protein [Candidatus Njordarchaeum guaymaensis]
MSVELSLKWIGDAELAVKFDKLESYKQSIEAPPEFGGKGKAPNPDRLLTAAVGGCLTLSLLVNLQVAKLNPKELNTKVKATIVPGDKGLPRFKSIDVELKPAFEGAINKDILKKVIDHFQNYCTVAQSVRKGIPVNVIVKE